MNSAASGQPDRQRGAATLLVALILMLSITTLTLAVARTTQYEQRMAANDRWQLRLSLQAASALAQAGPLLQNLDALAWQADGAGQLSRRPAHSDDAQISAELLLRRAPDARDLVLIEARTQRRDGSGMGARQSVWMRRLSLLSPRAETAPPLVLGGCLHGSAEALHLRPRHADSDRAGAAAWVRADRPCAPVSGVDTHHGAIVPATLHDDLWSDLFSIDRLAYAALVSADAGRPPGRRVYYRAQAADLRAGRWASSLGHPGHHVVLYFPAALGCPAFAPGVQIYGMVFIDADCTGTALRERPELHGILAINGSLDIGTAQAQLNHIALADPRLDGLRFPVLRSVPLPGSWRDF